MDLQRVQGLKPASDVPTRQRPGWRMEKIGREPPRPRYKCTVTADIRSSETMAAGPIKEIFKALVLIDAGDGTTL